MDPIREEPKNQKSRDVIAGFPPEKGFWRANLPVSFNPSHFPCEVNPPPPFPKRWGEKGHLVSDGKREIDINLCDSFVPPPPMKEETLEGWRVHWPGHELDEGRGEKASHSPTGILNVPNEYQRREKSQIFYAKRRWFGTVPYNIFYYLYAHVFAKWLL